VSKNKYIESPVILWKHFVDYKKETKQDPILVKDWVGKDADEVYKPKERPLTMEGFENWCADNDIINDLGDYFSNKNEKYSDYSTICSRIRRAIRQDQIEGGMVGIYNQSITQRLNGLVEKTQTEIKGGLNIPNLPDIGNR